MASLYRIPTDEDYRRIVKINPQVIRQNIAVIRFAAIHNLKTRSYYAWDLSSLQALADTYPGKKVIFNHAWEDAKEISGVVFSAEIKQLDSIPAEFTTSYNAKANEFLSKRYGVKYLELLAYIPRDTNLFKMIDSGLLNTDVVSIGGKGQTKALCPLSLEEIEIDEESEILMQMKCTPKDGRKKCFNCVVAIWGTADMVDKSAVPATTPIFDFYVITGLEEAHEISYVVVPNVPGAGHLPAI